MNADFNNQTLTRLQFLFVPRVAFWIVLLVAIAALASALVAQFGFAMKPCILCLWQRVPYLVMLFVAGLPLAMANHDKNKTIFFLGVLILACAASFTLAFFHIGVEQRLWTFGAGCPVLNLEGQSPADALAALLTTPQSDCSEVQWRLLGFSITVWNAALSLGLHTYLILLTIFYVRKK